MAIPPPLPYMRSAGEIAQLSDVDAASRLVDAYYSVAHCRDVLSALKSCPTDRLGTLGR